eukprot:7630849-Pyramimonas_sp.AAC.1
MHPRWQVAFRRDKNLTAAPAVRKGGRKRRERLHPRRHPSHSPPNGAHTPDQAKTPKRASAPTT